MSTPKILQIKPPIVLQFTPSWLWQLLYDPRYKHLFWGGGGGCQLFHIHKVCLCNGIKSRSPFLVHTLRSCYTMHVKCPPCLTAIYVHNMPEIWNCALCWQGHSTRRGGHSDLRPPRPLSQAKGTSSSACQICIVGSTRLLRKLVRLEDI